MRYVLDSQEMKSVDSYSIDIIGIPSVVLMEKAAMSVVSVITNDNKDVSQSSIVAVCGNGNNGGDAIACARMLFMKGYQVDLLMIGKEDKYSEQMKIQLAIAKNLGMRICSKIDFAAYNIIIDGIFGIGLQRAVIGNFADIIEAINASKAKVYAVDIPSGVDASTGHILNVAIRADVTVTFGEYKLGLLLHPGAKCAGRVVLSDIGFPKIAVEQVVPKFTMFEKKDLHRLPQRKENSNKGTFGKVLIIAGSANMTGAAYFSAAAAYRMGVGLVKVVTHPEALGVIRQFLPEALTDCYVNDANNERLIQSIAWADSIVVGPGLSKGEDAKRIIQVVCNYAKKPFIVDADAINILSETLHGTVEERLDQLSKIIPSQAIFTPHLKELSRLLDLSLGEIIGNTIDIANKCTYNNELTYVVKDARTIVAQNEKRYLNISGNHGMATGGSGDVLTGIIAGLAASGLCNYDAATLAVYIHGLAGDIAAEQKGYYSMLARDIIDALPEVLRKND